MNHIESKQTDLSYHKQTQIPKSSLKQTHEENPNQSLKMIKN